MKSDIALHEIMRIDEYEDENVQTDLADNSISKESESLVATQSPTESTTDNSESSISVDIPTDTVINYDEPPTALIDAPAEETVMTNDITPNELADMPAAEDISNDDEISTELALPTKPAIDLEKPLPEPAVPTNEAIINDDETSNESFAKQLESIPANTAGFFEEVIVSITEFFKNNRQLLTNLGIIFLAFIVTKLAFAGLSAIDDIPLVSPLLKLVGLFYVGRFVWNYLIRERDRHQLVEQFNSIKTQILGDRN
ncbi:CAAD domain-containing protein [Chamaesiphon sp. VAR_48_metabat_403]|uniref:CAAD domain-containing protein n=1 Tax=Chamaesiphon sp. VAR_48_metabat_403 TaxID=2964700 RepID=UPI00286DF516|nr:CAAD domain-containing protein [Chamaesiphon sp. VAR_48_metabat_403]